MAWKEFKKYAIENNVHSGPATVESLRRLYEEHKGSRYKTIVALFKEIGGHNFNKQYVKEVHGVTL